MVRSSGAFGLLFAVTPALAADPLPSTTAQLEYTRPPGCPTERDLRYEVSRRLGQDPFVAEGLSRVVAAITQQKNTLSGSLEIYDGDGQAVVRKHTSYPAWDCATLVSGMAIAILVRLDPPLLPPAPEKAPPPPAPPPPLPKVETPSAQAKPPAAVPTRLRGVVGLSPQVVFGPVGKTFGLVGHLGVRWPIFSPEMAFSLGTEVRFDAPSSAVVEVEGRPGVSVQQKFLLGGSLVSCLHWRSLFGCALASGGVLSIASEGFDDPDAASPALGYVRAEDALLKEGLDYVRRSLCQLGVPDADQADRGQRRRRPLCDPALLGSRRDDDTHPGMVLDDDDTADEAPDGL